MHRHRENFTREQFERRLEYGQEVLNNYYDKYIHSWNRVVAVERNIKNIVVNGVPLKGKLDKLEFEGKQVNYCGLLKQAIPIKQGPNYSPRTKESPMAATTRRQAVFYKILIDNYEKARTGR